MTQGPGNPGGDCKRCGETTVQVGVPDGGTVGVWCQSCDLVHLMGYHDVYAGEHGARPWAPEPDGDAND